MFRRSFPYSQGKLTWHAFVGPVSITLTLTHCPEFEITQAAELDVRAGTGSCYVLNQSIQSRGQKYLHERELRMEVRQQRFWPLEYHPGPPTLVFPQLIFTARPRYLCCNPTVKALCMDSFPTTPSRALPGPAPGEESHQIWF